jgi:hypothetical protein
MALAGDNLVVDLDLGSENLPAGQRLYIGDAVLEITDAPHTGCAKFVARFGPDATRFINAAERRALRLRGRYARIVQAGTVRVGDKVDKVPPVDTPYQRAPGKAACPSPALTGLDISGLNHSYWSGRGGSAQGSRPASLLRADPGRISSSPTRWAFLNRVRLLVRFRPGP